MCNRWKITWGRRRAKPKPVSTESGEPQADSSMVSTELAQASLSQPAHAIDHSLSATTESVPIATTDFQPLQLRKSKEYAKRAADLRVEIGKALPVCMVTRLRATKGLEKSTDGPAHNSEDA